MLLLPARSIKQQISFMGQCLLHPIGLGQGYGKGRYDKIGVLNMNLLLPTYHPTAYIVQVA